MRAPIGPCKLPPAALLYKYSDAGAYTDCYVTQIPVATSLADYVEAFYTTGVFKLERLILKWAVAKPSGDADVRRLACGQTDLFAAWRVEARAPDQLLLCDFQSRTRSWLMVAPGEGGSASTRLYFGSAIVAVRTRSGALRLSWGFRALLGFHKMYSRILLSAARSRLTARMPGHVDGTA